MSKHNYTYHDKTQKHPLKRGDIYYKISGVGSGELYIYYDRDDILISLMDGMCYSTKNAFGEEADKFHKLQPGESFTITVE